VPAPVICVGTVPSVALELGPEAVHTLLRYVTSALPPSSALRDTILDVITEEKRAMHMSVYDEMRAEGRAEGMTAGKAEGKLEGKAEGKLELFLQLLAHRGLVLDDDRRARVIACTDEAQAQRWFDRALTAGTLAAIFEEP
jgi:predicted transposase YdaD